jgi:putative transposon-encoded protein
MGKAEIQKMTSIAVPFGNGCHVVTPKSFLNKRVWVLTQDEYDDLREKAKKHDN